MKTFFKVILMVVTVIVLIAIAQAVFDFDMMAILKKHLGGTELKETHTTISKEVATPKFEIVSLEIFYPQALTVIEAHKKEWWRLNIGDVFILVEYDAYFKLGMRNPDLIRMERVGDTVYVDESTILIELLDAKLNNFRHVKTFKDLLAINNDAETFIFQALNEIEKELTNNIIENGQANFEAAKKNFMENYKNLCKGMGLEVVWI
jgi:hypothetical protein